LKTLLIILTLVEVLVLVVVLATYLITIAATLRKVSSTLGLVTFGVRAIEKQTQPIGPTLREINGALEQVAEALGHVAGVPDAQAQPASTTATRTTSETSGGGQSANP
jgi:uncharacterized protein YoxC